MWFLPGRETFAVKHTIPSKKLGRGMTVEVVSVWTKPVVEQSETTEVLAMWTMQNEVPIEKLG